MLLSPSSVSYYKGNSGAPPASSYAPQSYIGSDADSGMLSPQSILTSSSTERPPSRLNPSLSPPPQSYFDPRLSLTPVHGVQHQMHSRDSSIMPPISQIQPGHGVVPTHLQLPRPMSTHLQSEYPNEQQSISVYSQDSSRRASLQLQGSSYLPHSPEAAALSQHAAYPHSGQHSRHQSYPAPPTSHPHRASTGAGYLGHPPQESSADASIQEVPRHPERQSVVFQFGAPAGPAPVTEGPVFQFGGPASPGPATEGPVF
jgi:hypothetical protein